MIRPFVPKGSFAVLSFEHPVGAPDRLCKSRPVVRVTG
jgi:hypothetical protein